jgi:hypothetical protein
MIRLMQRFLVLSITVIASLSLLRPGLAQLTSGDLVGTVLDATGAGVPNVTVTATNTETGVKSSTTTAGTGQYRLTNLPVGTYDITASATGFTSATLKGVAVELNKVATANMTLQVGQLTTSIDVQESAAVIDTTTAQVQNIFTTKESQDLPVASVGLGVLNLSLLSSGVSSSGGVGAGTGPAVGGQRPRNNNFTIEGIDNNSKSVTGPLVFIPNDAVAEFSMLQNQFSAEYGHSSGGQFNTIVRSGTNELHGTIYDYLLNRNLNAIDQALQNQGFKENPRYDQNRLGATIGGPIKKNKWFYFGNFEYNPLGQASSQSAEVESPTAAGYATLAGLPGLSATNFGIFKQYVTAAPSPNGDFLLQGDGKTPVTIGGQRVQLGTLPLASPNYTNSYAAVISSDYTVSEKDQLRGRYIYNKVSGIDVAAELPQFYLALPTTYYLATLTEYHNFSPSITNEFRLGYNRYNNTTPAGDFKFPGLDQFPNIVLNDLNLNIGPDGNAPQFTIQNLYQVTDNVSWTKGAHTFKFGFDGRKAISPQSFTQRARGEYNYNSTILFLQDFTPDNLSERSVGNVIYYGDQIAAYPYVNDTWRIRPNFTLSLGLRYEYTTIPFTERSQKLNHVADVPGVLVFNEPKPQKTNFAPRVGIAYSPGTSGNTSIRAGFGMAYDVLYDNIGILALPPQLSTTVDTDPLGIATGSGPNFLKNGGIPPNAAVGALSRADAIASTANYVPDQKLPYSIQWNFGVQHVFRKDYTFEARYLGTRGVHLNVQDRINKQPKTAPDVFLPTYLQAPTQATLDSLTTTLATINARSNTVPRFAAAGFTNPIVEFSPIGNSTYHGLALQMNRRFSNGFQMSAAYTWSHLIDDSTADFFTTRLTPRRPQDFQNLRADRATSALDRRHRLTITAIYDVPFFKHSNWFAKNVIGNWEIAPIYTFESPEYATVQSSIDTNLNGDSAGDRTIINPSGTDGTSSNVTALTNSKGATVAYLATNPNARYIKAGAGAFANGGRNSLPVRRIDNLDFTILKRFSYGERLKLELFGQFFNGLNHPQFTPGLLNQVNSIGTTGSGVLNFVTAGNKAFNNPEVSFGSNPRSIQVAAKFRF